MNEKALDLIAHAWQWMDREVLAGVLALALPAWQWIQVELITKLEPRDWIGLTGVFLAFITFWFKLRTDANAARYRETIGFLDKNTGTVKGIWTLGQRSTRRRRRSLGALLRPPKLLESTSRQRAQGGTQEGQKKRPKGKRSQCTDRSHFASYIDCRTRACDEHQACFRGEGGALGTCANPRRSGGRRGQGQLPEVMGNAVRPGRWLPPCARGRPGTHLATLRASLRSSRAFTS